MNSKVNTNNHEVELKKVRKLKDLFTLLTCVLSFVFAALLIDVIILFKNFDKTFVPILMIIGLIIFIIVTLVVGTRLSAKYLRRERKIVNGEFNVIKAGETLLKVENLSQHFGPVKAVDNVSFEIKKGEAFGLVGESGCGKTTTGRTIIKLYKATGGNVFFKGQRIVAGTLPYKKAISEAKKKAKAEIDALKVTSKASPSAKINNDAKIAEIKRELDKIVTENKLNIMKAQEDDNHADKDLVTQIQMIFQDPVASLDPRMTVREIIAEGLVINGVTDKEYINQKVYEILETVGLVREHADRYPHEFSGGQKQRIGIARAVVMQPEMIIADEPVSALDVSIQAQVINLLNDLRERLGLTILFIAHDLSVVKYFSDRIGVMYFGKMVELADSDELFKNPLHPYTRSLLSAIPLPDPIYEKQRKRITYNPLAEHDYSTGAPSFREVAPGHFVYCNDAEEAKYKEILNSETEGQAQ
jgi:oligopeptide transport system ATP-binding protein